MKRDKTCRHFNGLDVGVTAGPRKACEAGVCYREFVGGPDLGWATRIPCLGEQGDAIVQCDRYERMTAEEIERRDAASKAVVDRFMSALPIIHAMKAEFDGRDGAKTVECPVCRGQLHMRHAAYNGHVWGRCDTDGCLAWME